MSKKRHKNTRLFLCALAGAGMWLVIGGVGALAMKIGGREIGTAQIVTQSGQTAVSEADLSAIKQSMVLTDISELAIDASLLADNSAEAPVSKLQPVYNAVFSKDGLQIASLSDTRLQCRSEAIVPLSKMLDAFYRETGLRTLMINKAYEPNNETDPDKKCAEHEDGYSFDFGLYLKDSDSRREFTLEGQYSWFSRNAWKYGFIRRYPPGSENITGKPCRDDHFRYVGRFAAKLINDNSICLEQLADLMSSHTQDDPIFIDSRTIVYMYTIPDGDSRIPVPSGQDGGTAPAEICYMGAARDRVLIAAQPYITVNDRS